jgi:aminotransferase in exopolysaccharide biosynthesis
MSSDDFRLLFSFIRENYGSDTVPLHAPQLGELEKQSLVDCIDSGFVSSVGPLVTEFENQLKRITGRRYVVATVNGTAALHLGLHASGVDRGCEVILSPMTFIASANAIQYCGAAPVFVDIESTNLGICPEALRRWLEKYTVLRGGVGVNVGSGRRVKGCLCMHTFGHPSKTKDLLEVCQSFGVELFEDAAEALGSHYYGQHVGGDGRWSALSFNGNKILTTGGGGALVTDDEEFATFARHLATTAKETHQWESSHDQIGFNYRMPSLNAALGCAQLQRFESIRNAKRKLAEQYREVVKDTPLTWVDEPEFAESNFWLNTVICNSYEQREALLGKAAQLRIQMRPVWKLLSENTPYQKAENDGLTVARELSLKLVNIPSTPPAIFMGMEST